MSYQAAVDRMYALGHELAQTPSHKFDLAHMRVLLAALEHPERRFPSVLIAGTNGKGSTAATLASILRASRLKAGIIRPGVPVVTLPQQPQANDVIGNAILDKGARGVNAVPYVPPVSPGSEQYSTRGTGKNPQPGYRYRLQVLGEEIVVETSLV